MIGFRVWSVGSLMAALCLCGFVLFGCTDPNAIPCSSSENCPADLYCIDGICKEKACTLDEQCGATQVCDKKTRKCKRNPQPNWRCFDDKDCRKGEECLGGRCRLASVTPCDPACKEDEQCVKGVCEKKVVKPECKTSDECSANLECQDGKCVLKSDTPCKSDPDCTSPMRCNLLVERCQKPCTASTDCSTGRSCRDQFCQLSCSDKLPCPKGKACKAGECIPEECNDSKPCSSPKICSKGLCADPECSAQKACTDNKICKEGRCVAPECGPAKACTAPKVCKDGQCITPSNKCDPGNPCPTGKKCWKGQCAPADYCERASDCNPGQSCQSNKCTGGTNPGCKSDSECKTGEYCDQGTCKTKPNTGIPIGGACQSTTSCVSGAVCTSNDSSGTMYCRKVCDPIKTITGCPANHGCSLLGNNRTGACFPNHGGKKAGEVCSSSNPKDCESGLLCIQNGSQNVCMKLCDRSNPNCPNGETCADLQINPVGACIPKGSGKQEGESCTKRSDCANNMYCLGITGQGTCTPGCDPTNPTCRSGKVCALLMKTYLVLEAAVCGPSVGTTGPGKLCNANRSTCVSYTFCFPNLKNLSQSLCAIPCDPKAPRCPAGQQCVISPVSYKGANLYGCI